MRLPDADAHLLLQVGRQNRDFVEVLERLRTSEMEATLKGPVDRFLTHKGRVEVLTELLQQLKAEPTLAPSKEKP